MPGPRSSVTGASYELTVTGVGDVAPRRKTSAMPPERFDDDPAPPGIVLDLGEALRVLEALEDALDTMEGAGLAPGLQDEVATVIRVLHVRLGFDEGELR